MLKIHAVFSRCLCKFHDVSAESLKHVENTLDLTPHPVTVANKGLVWDFPCNVILMPTGICRVGGRSKRYFKNTQKHLGFLFCGINKLAYPSWILIWFIASKRKIPPNIYDVTPHLFATKTGDPFETFASVWNFFRGFSAGSVLGIFTPEPWGTDLKL